MLSVTGGQEHGDISISWIGTAPVRSEECGTLPAHSVDELGSILGQTSIL
jgi:hypothetical protein